MTDKKQPEALRLADWVESVVGGPHAKQCAAELRRLHAENETLRTGYAAARLEIESLRAAQPAGAQQPGAAYAAVTDERAAFEAMMRSQTFDSLKRLSDGSYESYEARVGWMAWNVRASHGQAPAQAAPELTETAITAKNPAAPVSSFEDLRTQAVYEVLVNDNYPPAGSNEHWEGWKARLIVDALFPIAAPAAGAVAGSGEVVAHRVVLDAFENKTRGIPQAHIAAALVAELRAAIEAASTTPTAQEDAQDAARLDWLRDNSCDLRCVDSATGQGDGDIHWIVIEHHMAAPVEREIGRAYRDDPRVAIDAARAAQEGKSHG